MDPAFKQSGKPQPEGSATSYRFIPENGERLIYPPPGPGGPGDGWFAGSVAPVPAEPCGIGRAGPPLAGAAAPGPPHPRNELRPGPGPFPAQPLNLGGGWAGPKPFRSPPLGAPTPPG